MRKALNILLICVLVFSSGELSGQFLNNFAHRAKVVIAGVPALGTGTLVDYPFYFEYQSNSLRTKKNGGLVDSEEGLDIWFGEADGTIIYSEIEHYDPLTGSIAAWIRLAEFTPATGSGFFLHIGNPLIENRPGSSFVWSADFVGVWHMNGSGEDASAHANHGRVYGARASDGMTGGSLSFDGVNDSLLVPNSSNLNFSEAITIEALIRLHDDSDDDWVVAGKYLDYWLSCNGELFSFWAGETHLDVKNMFVQDTWYHIVGTYDRSVMRIFVNGTEVASQVNNTAISNDGSKPFSIASYPDEPSTWNFPGQIDEVRVMEKASEEIWIKTCYANMRNPSGLISVSAFHLSNNLPCRAIQIDTEAELNQIPFSNFLSVDPGIPLTECAGYIGNDAWFKLIAPANGMLNIQLSTDPTPDIPQAGEWIQRSGLAVYNDTCNSLNYMNCWIDEVASAPHIQPEIELSGLEHGEELYLRVWGFGGARGFFSMNFSSEDVLVFQLSGSGSYCEGESGREITLNGSENGFLYQLKRNGTDHGASITGNGSALSWSDLEEGVYEVYAKEEAADPEVKMDGRAIIKRLPLPVTNFGYSFEKSLTIESDSVYGSTDMVDFPVLISIDSDADLALTTSGGHVEHSSGYDIAFTDENFEPLPFELVDYNGTSGSLQAWVRIPVLTADFDTELHLLYGNSSIQTNLSTGDVWSQPYKQVLHLDEDLSDASGNGNYGAGESLQVMGKISSSRGFDGIDDLLLVQNDTSLEGTASLSTISLWINFENAADGDHQLILCDEDRYSIGQGYEWAQQGDGDNFFYPNGNHTMNYNLGSGPFINDQWHYLVTTLEYQSKEVKIYLDGEPLSLLEENVPAYWSEAATFSSWLWGGNPDRSSRYFLGEMDEIRVQSLVRSQDWIRTEYSNQNEPEAFITLSSEKVLGSTDALCSTSPAIPIEQALPSGGVFSGSGVSGLSFDPAVAGMGEQTITYTLTDNNGCISQNSRAVMVLNDPTPLISGEDLVQENAEAVEYSTAYTLGNSYVWEINSNDALIVGGQGENSILVDWGVASGVLSVTETDPIAGCVGISGDFEVVVSNDSITEEGIVIPEVFTPNEDGWNDRFEIIGLDKYPGNELEIYNVNGIMIFQMSDYDSSWDGTSTAGSASGNKLPSGTYYYVLKLNTEKTLKGFIYLRRN